MGSYEKSVGLKATTLELVAWCNCPLSPPPKYATALSSSLWHVWEERPYQSVSAKGFGVPGQKGSGKICHCWLLGTVSFVAFSNFPGTRDFDGDEFGCRGQDSSQGQQGAALLSGALSNIIPLVLS